jgi:hypothetical protein
MYSRRHNLILGFHGCDLSVRDRVVRLEEPQKYEKNDYDWLGNGYYFWENNNLRALEFAHEMKSYPNYKDKIKNPSVLGAIIDLGYCLDLLDSSFIKLLKEIYDIIKEESQNKHIELPKNTSFNNNNDLPLRKLDCLVIETLHKYYSEIKGIEFDTVRSGFFEGDPLYDTSGFKTKNHIQICVRNSNNIKGYFIPREKCE